METKGELYLIASGQRLVCKNSLTDALVFGKKTLEEELINNSDELDVVSEQPYTYARIRVSFNGTEYCINGFAKISGSDKWNKEYGIHLAKLHAVRKLLKKLRKQNSI